MDNIYQRILEHERARLKREIEDCKGLLGLVGISCSMAVALLATKPSDVSAWVWMVIAGMFAFNATVALASWWWMRKQRLKENDNG